MDSLAREAVVPRLGGCFGHDYRYLESTPSTQLLLAPEAPEGAVAVAGEQTEGRRRPSVSGERLPELTGAAAPACAEVIEAATGLKAELKFPPATSLVEAGREIDRAGLLVELLERLERRYDAWANVSPG